MESRNPDADATPDEDEQHEQHEKHEKHEKSSPEEPKTGDEHAYEDDWYKVLKRRAEQSEDSED